MTKQYLDEAKSPIQQQEHGGQIDLKRTKMLVVVHTIVFCLTMIIQRAVRILKLVNSAPKPFHWRPTGGKIAACSFGFAEEFIGPWRERFKSFQFILPGSVGCACWGRWLSHSFR